MQPEYREIHLDDIKPSPFQPRKHFDEDKLNELAVTIGELGVQEPIKVRPKPNGKVESFELIFGERRWRASRIAGKDTIPSLVVEMTDKEVMEVQLVENDQRADITPLEQASLYKRLIDEQDHTIETLMERTGRSKSYIYQRMQLLRLAPGVLKLLESGKLSPGHAELICRVPDPKLQLQFANEVLGIGGHKVTGPLQEIGVEHEQLNDEPTPMYMAETDVEKYQPLSYRATRALLARKYTTKLQLAKFDIADATLVAAAGACTTCPHRSGNQPELPGLGEGKAADYICTHTACFEDKTAAAWKRVAEVAKAEGKKVLTNKEAKNVFSYDGVKVSHSSPYVELAQELPHEFSKTPGKQPSFKKLLGKREAEVPRVIVQDESGAPRELLDRRKAIEILREEGKIPKAEPEKKSKPFDFEASQARHEEKRELGQAALLRVLETVATTALEDPGKREMAWWRWMTRAVFVFDNYRSETGVMLERRSCKTVNALDELVDKCKTVGEIRSILIEFLLASHGDAKTTSWSDKSTKDVFADGLKLFGADWDKALAAAKEAAKAEKAVEDAKKKAKDEKKPDAKPKKAAPKKKGKKS